MQEENGRLPRCYDKEDAASLVQLANKINEQANNKVDLDEVCGTDAPEHACISAPTKCCKLMLSMEPPTYPCLKCCAKTAFVS